MNAYRHTQFGKVIVIAIGTGIVILIASAAISLAVLPASAWVVEMATIALLGSIVVVLAVALALFASLTVEIDAEYLRIRFGIGLIRKRFPLDQIDTCRSVTNLGFTAGASA